MGAAIVSLPRITRGSSRDMSNLATTVTRDKLATQTFETFGTMMAWCETHGVCVYVKGRMPFLTPEGQRTTVETLTYVNPTSISCEFRFNDMWHEMYEDGFVNVTHTGIKHIANYPSQEHLVGRQALDALASLRSRLYGSGNYPTWV